MFGLVGGGVCWGVERGSPGLSDNFLANFATPLSLSSYLKSFDSAVCSLFLMNLRNTPFIHLFPIILPVKSYYLC